MITVLENELSKLAEIELPEGETLLIKTDKKPTAIHAARLHAKAAAIMDKRKLGYGIHLLISDKALTIKVKKSKKAESGEGE